MCEILEVIKTEKEILVECTHHEGDFMNAKTITIFDRESRPAKITRFCMDRTRQCFNDNPVAPWFRIDEKIDERFLQRGNTVLIE